MLDTINIYVANLAAYNDGVLKGEWFTLPTSMRDIFDTIFDEDELDEHGHPYGDWAIHDYEAAFEISEYESIDKLNEIAEIFNSLSLKEVEALLAMYNDLLFSDLSSYKDKLSSLVWYNGCTSISEVIYNEFTNMYDPDEHPLLYSYFDFKEYTNDVSINRTFHVLEESNAVVEVLNT